MNQRPPVVAIALLSLATLAYEILLMRLFSITQWHHFAWMIISLALLGYGASGAFVTLLQQPLQRRFPLWFTLFTALFGIAALGCYLLARRIPFNAEELLWDPAQPWWLLATYLSLAVPFFLAASAIALALARFRDDIGRLYAFDLFGAGAGGLVVIALLFLLLPQQALAAIGLIALLAAFVAAWELGWRRSWRVPALLSLPLLALVFHAATDTLRISPYKGLPQTLRISGATVVEQRSSPLGLLTVVENRTIPFRHAPGLSLMASQEPPPQIAIFTDGDGMTVVTRDRGDAADFRYLDETPTALPYHLRPIASALILGAGGGADVLQAKYHGVDAITAVELNPQLVDLVRNRYGDFSGHLYDSDNVTLHIADARGFVGSTDTRFSLIQIPPLDAFGSGGTGLHALNENYLYTVEAMQRYLDHLDDNGYLSISRWVRLPPRETLKLFATAVAALKARGVEDPGRHLLLIRGWQLATLLVKTTPLEAEEIERLKRFARERAFDLAWYPGMAAAEANRYNRLQAPWFHEGARALVGDNAADYIARYKFDLTPPTDDRPYFFHLLRWSALPELFSLRRHGGMALLEQSYLVLVATLVQAIVASLILILLPLAFLPRQRDRSAGGIARWKVVVYFFAIGLAFLFIEMSFIQKFLLLLHHPLYSAATVMTGFLVFAGAGSLFSQRLGKRNRRRRIGLVVGAIIISAILLLLALQLLQDFLLGLPLGGRIVISLGLLAPLAFFMGMPFPIALSTVGERAQRLIPWAWGINGCASVISAVLATLLAMHGGFTAVILTALALYLLAAVTYPRPRAGG